MNGDLSKRFHHQATSLWRTEGLPEEKNWPEEWKKAAFKTYPRFPQIPLTNPIQPARSLEDVLTSRQTSRSFDTQAFLSLEELSTILFLSGGIRTEDKSEEASKRFYPSGGRRYPLEIYVCVERVSGLEPGIYHFNVRDNSLEHILEKDFCHEFKKSFGYVWCKDASVSILITSVWDRTFEKYRDFGYRFVYMEAGHLTQNLQLTSESLGLAYASVAGFREKEMDALLNLNPEIETSLYLTIIGKTKASNPKTA